MMEFHIELSLALFLIIPLLGSVIALLLWRMPELIKWATLATSGTTFALAVALYISFPADSKGWFAFVSHEWIPAIGAGYIVGIDGISLMMILLTTFLTLVAVLAGWNEVRSREALYYSLFLLMETGVLGIFISLDLLLFYLFWELMLIPILFLVGIYGSNSRGGESVTAAMRFFLYALAGSLVMLLAIISLYLLHGEQTGEYSFALATLAQTELPVSTACWLLCAFLLAFFIKTPLVPFHRWLPAIYKTSPTGVILGGVIIKTGIYAILRFSPTLFPHALTIMLPWIAFAALIAILYAGWIACVQRDIFGLLAYSSISHAGFILLGIAAWQRTAIDGALLQMLNHSIVAGALLYMTILIRERAGTTQMKSLGGLWGKMPRFSTLFLFFSMALLGLPGTNSFAGEFLILSGLSQVNPFWLLAALPGLLLATIYTLRLLVHTLWGEATDDIPMEDLSLREGSILFLFAVLVLWIGIYPAPFLEPMQGAVGPMMTGGWL